MFVPPDGVLIDMSHMKDISIDPAGQQATLQPGVLSSELSAQLLPHGLFFPVGYISSVGLAGFCLGGGVCAVGAGIARCMHV